LSKVTDVLELLAVGAPVPPPQAANKPLSRTETKAEMTAKGFMVNGVDQQRYRPIHPQT
jgi:hypothetical protein